MLFSRKILSLANENENLICIHFSRNLFISFSYLLRDFFYIKQMKERRKFSWIESLKGRKRALIKLKSALLENLHNFQVVGGIRSGNEENEDLDKGKTFVRHPQRTPAAPDHPIVQSKEQQKANKINWGRVFSSVIWTC